MSSPGPKECKWRGIEVEGKDHGIFQLFYLDMLDPFNPTAFRKENSQVQHILPDESGATFRGPAQQTLIVIREAVQMALREPRWRRPIRILINSLANDLILNTQSAIGNTRFTSAEASFKRAWNLCISLAAHRGVPEAAHVANRELFRSDSVRMPLNKPLEIEYMLTRNVLGEPDAHLTDLADAVRFFAHNVNSASMSPIHRNRSIDSVIEELESGLNDPNLYARRFVSDDSRNEPEALHWIPESEVDDSEVLVRLIEKQAPAEDTRRMGLLCNFLGVDLPNLELNFLLRVIEQCAALRLNALADLTHTLSPLAGGAMERMRTVIIARPKAQQENLMPMECCKGVRDGIDDSRCISELELTLQSEQFSEDPMLRVRVLGIIADKGTFEWSCFLDLINKRTRYRPNQLFVEDDMFRKIQVFASDIDGGPCEVIFGNAPVPNWYGTRFRSMPTGDKLDYLVRAADKAMNTDPRYRVTEMPDDLYTKLMQYESDIFAR